VSSRLSILLALVFSFSPAGTASANTFLVTSANDTHDQRPGDGICSDSMGQCSLRAAVDEANTASSDTVLITAGNAPIFLSLGPITVTAPDILIAGADFSAMIDGRFNPSGTDNLELWGRGCEVYNCTIANARRNGVRVGGGNARIGRAGFRTVFVGNGRSDSSSAAIVISGPGATGTVVVATWVGLQGNGTVVDANQYGIRIENGHRISVGGGTAADRNLIGGNLACGILIDSGSSDVTITGNYIGLDITGKFAAPNGGDGVRIRHGSHGNLIGGQVFAERNLISGNLECGVTIVGKGSDFNRIGGNLIGLDSAGYIMVGNHRAGVRVSDSAAGNLIGFDSAGVGLHLVVSGNYGNGIEIVGPGTDSNRIDWSYVGLDGRGTSDRPNGLRVGQGILIAGGARHNIVGSESSTVRNVVSGNYGPGITIAGAGTNHNQVIGNYVGPTRLGNGSVGNSAGIVIRDSARFNEIGSSTTGNLISGNNNDLFPLGAGVVIYGATTDFNVVRRNLIGVDYTGTRAIRNPSAGVIIGGGASHNLIGGDSTVGNQISGNGTWSASGSIGAGIHIFGPGTDSNVISGNLIGVAADHHNPVPNNGHGIGIFGGARYTIIGGQNPTERNIIARNKYAGVWVEGVPTYGHDIRINSIVDNDSIGIALREHANREVKPPTGLFATLDTVYGDYGVPKAVIDLYRAKTDKAGHGEGSEYLGSCLVGPTGTFACPVTGLLSGDTVTAVATVDGSGSSEFSAVAPVAIPTGVDNRQSSLPDRVSLYQNTPNPFNSNTIIQFDIPRTQEVALEVINLLGERVTILTSGLMTAGHHSIEWDGKTSGRCAAASGVYFYRLSAAGETITKKMLLLK
jgi:CSLREA domain-containing protein